MAQHFPSMRSRAEAAEARRPRMHGLLTKSMTRAVEQTESQKPIRRQHSSVVDSVENRWSIALIFRCQGSVFPRALVVAIPSLVVVIGLRLAIHHFQWTIPELGGSQIWTGYNTALGFLIIFRTQKAYSRWWEGGTLLQQVRGEWYNATSSLIAFCSADESRATEIRDFQHLLVRLMSLLYCSALQQVAMLEDDCFEILNTDGLDTDSLKYLVDSNNRCEVLISWLQKLITNEMKSGVINVAPPVVTRVFQEISRGFVNLNNVKKIREFPFPFPYAQMITLMLMIHWIITPIASCLIVDNIVWATVLTFITIFAFWCINYIAEEIEMPFGDDFNDLPIAFMQKEMNNSLYVLLQRGSQTPPTFTFSKSLHKHKRISKATSMTSKPSDCWYQYTKRDSRHSQLSYITLDEADGGWLDDDEFDLKLGHNSTERSMKPERSSAAERDLASGASFGILAVASEYKQPGEIDRGSKIIQEGTSQYRCHSQRSAGSSTEIARFSPHCESLEAIEPTWLANAGGGIADGTGGVTQFYGTDVDLDQFVPSKLRHDLYATARAQPRPDSNIDSELLIPSKNDVHIGNGVADQDVAQAEKLLCEEDGSDHAEGSGFRDKHGDSASLGSV